MGLGTNGVEIVKVVSADLFERSFVTANSQVLVDNGQEVAIVWWLESLRVSAEWTHLLLLLVLTETIEKPRILSIVIYLIFVMGK